MCALEHQFMWMVSRRKEDFSLQAAIMVLMISVKTACKSGWFLAKDAEDLLTLANEFWSSYCSTEYIQAQLSNDLTIIIQNLHKNWNHQQLALLNAITVTKY